MASKTLKILGKAIYGLRRWHFEPLPDYWQPKQVLIAFPHTDVLDTWMAFAGFAMIEQKGHIIVKKEAFFWPFATPLKALGAIPIDRKASTGIVGQMAAAFADRDEFQLALVPEGTRSKVTKLKTGFWHIAKAADVQIVLWYIDTAGKRTRWLGRIVPSDDIAADVAEIKRIYAEAGHEIVGKL